MWLLECVVEYVCIVLISFIIFCGIYISNKLKNPIHWVFILFIAAIIYFLLGVGRLCLQLLN